MTRKILCEDCIKEYPDELPKMDKARGIKFTKVLGTLKIDCECDDCGNVLVKGTKVIAYTEYKNKRNYEWEFTFIEKEKDQ